MKTKLAVGAALAGAFVLGASVVAYSAAQQSTPQSKPAASVSTSFSDLEEQEIGGIIRAYLMDNPEVILESVDAYREREQLAAIEHTRLGAKENLAALLDDNTSFVAGRDTGNAKVAVIELFDYHCTYCKRAAGMVKDLTASDKDVMVVFRELPILRKESEYAAEMALASREQGKFLDFHFAMMNASGVLTEKRVKDIAKSQGINVTALVKAQKDSAISAAIAENFRITEQMGVDGTPAFIIATLDGSYVEVLQGFQREALTEKIEAAKAAADK